MTASSANFDFLRPYDEQLVRLGALAERYFQDDPGTSLIKSRQLGEVLAQLTAAKAGLFTSTEEPQVDLLRRLKFDRVIPEQAAQLFHQIRVLGNRATHANSGTHADALTALKFARELGIWFHRTFGGGHKFSPGPFAPPRDPNAPDVTLREELERLRQELDATRSAAARARQSAEEHARERLTAEERARREADDRAIWERLAVEADQARSDLAAQLVTLQAAASQTAQATAAIVAKAETAAAEINIDEAATRVLIDAQLVARGWDADTEHLRYSKGTRPAKGRNLAIAEWPTDNGPADYALFVGTKCVGVVEAKRRNKNVSAHIDQSERYARGFRLDGGAEAVGGPWPDGTGGAFKVPFLFSANGRPYLKQLETHSGVWFRDARRAANHRKPLVDWLTPDGLLAKLDIDVDAAQEALKNTPTEFAFPLRPYQKAAIEHVEAGLDAGKREMLLAMATGTGKTKLSIAMLYRLLAAKRFRRICFVVDRTALGSQAAGEFSTTRIISAKTFADIFGLKGLETATPDSETRVHICTIQGLVKRVLYAADPSTVPPVDQYDLMVVDECHRGYLLDRELSDTELSFKNEDDYISKYRRVLEYFDAVKVGLTATPALHTVNIFGDPIFRYSYREAVVDGFLVDHEPPIQITTALSQAGIKFEKGADVELLDLLTGHVDLTHVPDEIHFEVDEFNKAVVTVSFNRAVARELARHIDPNLSGKTLIFAVGDAHADIVVDEVKKAFEEAYGEIDDAAVKKITGSVDRPGKQILAYRNDAMPKIAVTVDLLTTGVDIPSISNLVFLRRVNSRILYEQMLGRATRLCPEIGKDTFRIFDAVNLYPTLQHLTEMKPVVVQPKVTLEKLFDELPRLETPEQKELVRDQILVLMRRRLRRMAQRARAKFEAEAGETPEATLKRITAASPDDIITWLKGRKNLGAILEWDPDGAVPSLIPISHHPDEVISVTRGYGAGQKPADFLEGFTQFVKTHTDQIAALTVVLQRPRELTRAALKSLRMALDSEGYSEASLRRAWSDEKNEDIAASIIGFVRQAALGDALAPFEVRVKKAMQRILRSRSWTDVQKKWLKRIEEQLLHEVVVDRAAIDEEPFRADGGFQRLNKIFGGQLEVVLGDINEELWKTAA
jgi:type I restriction enzyme R subunit